MMSQSSYATVTSSCSSQATMIMSSNTNLNSNSLIIRGSSSNDHLMTSSMSSGVFDYFYQSNHGKIANMSITIAKSLIQASKGILLDFSLHRYYDKYKKSYAELLFRWCLLQQRAEILKNLTEISETNTITRMGVDFSIVCRNCGQSAKGPYCQECKRIASICAICHTPAKGLCTFCPLCGHGGHATHMLQWFSFRKLCPSGCGCCCVTEANRRMC